MGVWPALLALWIASVLVSVLLLSSRRPSDRWISALLAAHWAWSALAYHVGFFTRINQATWVFAALFLLQAAVFFWAGVVHGRLSFAPGAPPGRRWHGGSSRIARISGDQRGSASELSRIPTFGVPCPTMIFTAGMLMLATPRSWRLSIVPVIWSLSEDPQRSSWV